MRAALTAADAGGLVREALTHPDVDCALRSAAAVDVVAVGKAAWPMLRAAVAAGADVPLRHVVGVSTQPPPASSANSPGVQWYTAAHPVPDGRSVAAAGAVLEIASTANDDDLLVLLLSGGTSALMALSVDGISLQDKQRTSRRLLQEGAEIHGLNAVRKHLSAIKGGRWRRPPEGPSSRSRCQTSSATTSRRLAPVRRYPTSPPLPTHSWNWIGTADGTGIRRLW